MRHPIVLEGFIIPSGYTLVVDWGREHPGLRIDKKFLRYLSVKDMPLADPYFVFDPEDKNYKSLLANFRRDTRKLSRALKKELERRNRGGKPLSIWIEDMEPNLDIPLLRIQIILRPLFFHSNIANKFEERMQETPEVNQLILHFDEVHKLQTVRYFSSRDGLSNFVRAHMSTNLFSLATLLQREYGNWELIAREIIDKLAVFVEVVSSLRRN